jgi:hypothetical protein
MGDVNVREVFLFASLLLKRKKAVCRLSSIWWYRARKRRAT